MTNNIVPLDFNNLPSIVQEGNNDLSTNLMGDLGGEAVPRLSLKGSRFHFVDHGETIHTVNDPSLPVIIVGASPHIQRSYFLAQYDGSESQPDCSSSDGVTPDAGCKAQQAATCAQCPKNVKGAEIRDGKAITPCSFSKNIAVMIAGDVDMRVWQLRLNSMTLFAKDGMAASNMYAFKEYLAFLGAHNAPPDSLITTLTFDSRESVPKLLFSPTDMVGSPSGQYDVTFYQGMKAKVAETNMDATLGIRKATTVGMTGNKTVAPPTQAGLPVPPPAPVVPAPAPTVVPPTPQAAPVAPPPAQVPAPVAPPPVQAAPQIVPPTPPVAITPEQQWPQTSQGGNGADPQATPIDAGVVDLLSKYDA